MLAETVWRSLGAAESSMSLAVSSELAPMTHNTWLEERIIRAHRIASEVGVEFEWRQEVSV
jgi:hypothetical protein